MTDLEEQKPGVSRRTVAKAMAWSVPAVALAVPAPAYAASPTCLDSGLCFGCATVHKCCSGGPQALYWACVIFTNNGPTDVDVTFSFVVNTSANGPVPLAGGGTVPAGQTITFRPVTPRQYGNCSTGTYDAFDITFSDGITQGTARVPGGSIEGGGNTCPGNTPCAC
jgi:hypothetical protein